MVYHYLQVSANYEFTDEQARQMKQRLLVMNGQKIVQSEQAGAWINQKVDKAGALNPGIYNLYMAQVADCIAPAKARSE